MEPTRQPLFFPQYLLKQSVYDLAPLSNKAGTTCCPAPATFELPIGKIPKRFVFAAKDLLFRAHIPYSYGVLLEFLHQWIFTWHGQAQSKNLNSK
jgi:hypothetical protein